MRTRKGITIFIVFLLILCSCSYDYPEHPDYTLTAEQFGYHSTTNKSGELWEQFGLTLILSPKSNGLEPIYLMTCSWTENSITNNSNLNLGTSCDANYLSRVSLNPDEYLELTTIASSDSGYDPTSSKFRIALIAIDTTELDFGFFLLNPKAEGYLDSLKLQPERLIWSNEIQLKRFETQKELPWGKWEKKKSI